MAEETRAAVRGLESRSESRAESRALDERRDRVLIVEDIPLRGAGTNSCCALGL